MSEGFRSDQPAGPIPRHDIPSGDPMSADLPLLRITGTPHERGWLTAPAPALSPDLRRRLRAALEERLEPRGRQRAVARFVAALLITCAAGTALGYGVVRFGRAAAFVGAGIGAPLPTAAAISPAQDPSQDPSPVEPPSEALKSDEDVGPGSPAQIPGADEGTRIPSRKRARAIRAATVAVADRVALGGPPASDSDTVSDGKVVIDNDSPDRLAAAVAPALETAEDAASPPFGGPALRFPEDMWRVRPSDPDEAPPPPGPPPPELRIERGGRRLANLVLVGDRIAGRIRNTAVALTLAPPFLSGQIGSSPVWLHLHGRYAEGTIGGQFYRFELTEAEDGHALLAGPYLRWPLPPDSTRVEEHATSLSFPKSCSSALPFTSGRYEGPCRKGPLRITLAESWRRLPPLPRLILLWLAGPS